MTKFFSNYKIAIHIYSLLRRLRIRSEKKYCPFCEEETWYVPFGLTLRPAQLCSKCESVRRHRDILRTFNLSPEILEDKKDLLYVSPDLSLVNYLKKKVERVTTCNYGGGKNVDLDIDITNINLPDESFDMVVAIHVLEHITEDHRALSEVRRILKPNGVFLVMVPQNLTDPKTIEEPISNPLMRLVKYGQHDHVRLYGLDFSERVAKHGFHVTIYANMPYKSTMYNDDFVELDQSDATYICRKTNV